MSGFEVHLQHIVDAMPGALAATLMGVDGLAVATVEREALEHEDGLDVSSLLVEFSSVLAQVQRTGEIFAAGPVEELTVRSERLVTVLRPVSAEYFVALAMRPEGLLGKGRYLLRVHGARLVDELV